MGIEEKQCASWEESLGGILQARKVVSLAKLLRIFGEGSHKNPNFAERGVRTFTNKFSKTVEADQEKG